MSPENLLRRSILAGTASVPALPVVALASTEPDPIYAAIEAHRSAFLRRLKASRINSHLEEDDSPEKRSAEEANSATYAAKVNAELDLVETGPTTHAGILALLAYVDDFSPELLLPHASPNF